MRMRAGISATIAAVVLALGLATAPAAEAGFGVSKWEAGACTVSVCNYSSPEAEFYTQVAGRPDYGITDFSFNTNGLGFPEGAVHDVRVDLPPGLSVNPQATGQCTEGELEGAGVAACTAKGAKVGQVEVMAVNPLGVGVPVAAPVFNIVPR